MRKQISFIAGTERGTITKTPCPRCERCSHVEAVTFDVPGQPPQVLTGDVAEVMWHVIENDARRNSLGIGGGR